MKKSRKLNIFFVILSILIAVGFVIFCCFYYQYYIEKKRILELSSLDIKVSCEYCTNPNELQSTIDKYGIVAYYPPYIFGHASNDFYGLWNITEDDSILFDGKQYIFSFMIRGYSDDGIYTSDGSSIPDADLYLCTCVPDGSPYEIYIIGIDKKKN